MYLICIVITFMASLATAAKELQENKNLTKFLPYTLKQESKETDIDVSLQNIEVLNRDTVYSMKDKEALSLYEEKDDALQPQVANGWKRLTKFLPSGYRTSNLIGQHLELLNNTVFLWIHLAILSYILFSGITLLHRLLSLPQPSAVGEGPFSNYYKSDL